MIHLHENLQLMLAATYDRAGSCGFSSGNGSGQKHGKNKDDPGKGKTVKNGGGGPHTFTPGRHLESAPAGKTQNTKLGTEYSAEFPPEPEKLMCPKKWFKKHHLS